MLGFYTMGIRENLAAVHRAVYRAAVKARRNPQDIKIAAVTKTVALPEILEVVSKGVYILGENRVQEAQIKVASYKLQAADKKVEWHLIGHLQKNKAKYAVSLFDLIQTVDSCGLAEEINRHAKKSGKKQRALVQVNLSEETAKHGAPEKELMGLLEKVSEMEYLKLEGLMTMPPYFEDPEKARPYFRRLREIRDEAEKKGLALPDLSMGMSHDFETAIEEGATIVRIGTAIFGERRQ